MSPIHPPSLSTSLSISSGIKPFSYKDTLVLMGSCFSEVIGEHLREDQIKTVTNPYGIVYNPGTLALQVKRLVEHHPPQPEELFTNEGLWRSFWFHGKYAHPNKDRALQGMTVAFHQGKEALLQASHLIITWGHTQMFKEVTSGFPVANCHKLPASHFQEVRATLPSLKTQYQDLFALLHHVNPALKVIITVSPVRYLRQGMVANTRSKALLHLLAQELEGKGVVYFPAYELLLDELRDYRYYGDDLIHPSQLATRIIYQRFLDTWLDQKDEPLLQEVRKLTRFMAHRPLHSETPAYDRHVQSVEVQRNTLRARFPELPHLFNT